VWRKRSHFAGGGHGVVGQAPGRIHLGDADLLLGESGQVLGDGIGENDLPLFRQHHRRDGHEGLRHRVEAEDGVLRHRRAARRIAGAEGLEVGDAALARDDRDGAGKLLRLDLRLQRLPDPS
jgi:hypothetical protein